MKLKKLIKLLDPCVNIKIFATNPDDDEEPIYEGIIFNIPWWIVELKIPKRLSNGSEPIHTWYIKYNSENMEGILIVNVDL